MSAAITVVRERIGRRHRITPAEMVQLLMALPMDLVNASTITARTAQGGLYVGGRVVAPSEETRATASAWADHCRGITCVSVVRTSYYVGDARRTGLGVRHDEPGSMHPGHRAELIFVPHTLSTNLTYLRSKCKRLLIVDPQA